MRAQATNAFSQRVVVGGDHPPFAGRHVLVGEERKTTNVAKRTKPGIIELRRTVSGAMAGVFDEGEVVVPAQLNDLLHARRITAIVHDNDCLGVRADLGLNVCRINGRLHQRNDIREHRHGTNRHRHIRAGNEIYGWLNDFVCAAFADVKCKHCKVKCGRTAGDRDRMLCVAQLCKLLLKHLGPAAHRQPAGLQAFECSLLLLWTEGGF